MKEETLYVENLTTSLTSGQNIDHISFSLDRGEILGITGLHRSGIVALADALTGEIRPSAGTIYLDGEPVSLTSRGSANDLGIYEIKHSLSVIPTLSISENLNVLRRFSWRNFFIRKRLNQDTTRLVFERYGISGDPDDYTYELTKGQQMELSICRALLCGARVLICWEAGEGFCEEELAEFKRFLHQIRDEGTPVIMINSDARKVMQFADRIAVIRSGMLCYDRNTAEASLDEVFHCIAGEPLAAAPGGMQKAFKPLLSLRGLWIPESPSRRISTEVYAGTVLGLYWAASGWGDMVYQVFSGKRKSTGTVVEGDRALPFSRWRRKNREKILCLGMRFWENALHENMTVAENLALRTYARYKSRAGVYNRRMLRLALREFAEAHGIDPDCLEQYPRHLPPELRNQIVLWGALFAPPKLLVLDCPMYTMDEQIRQNFLNCLTELRGAGTAILWSNNNSMILNTYCDRVVTVAEPERSLH